MKRLLILLALLTLTACGGRGGDGEAPVDPLLSSHPNVYPYRNASPWRDVLKGCVNISASNQSCLVADLPPIGRNNAAPTVDDIMARVLVSHDWMGARFETLLRQQLPADLRQLLRSVTVIVIDADIRPSYYWAMNGAIHLDPAYLWLSNAEKADVAQAEDFRSNFGADLQFEFYSRYLKNGDYAWRYFPLTGTEERTLADIDLNFARLLYHELAHAGDFLPASAIASLDAQKSFFYNIFADTLVGQSDWLSPQLTASHPLTSETLRQLALVRFGVGQASSEQSAFTAASFGSEFGNDGSAHFYGYYTVHEDLAMLFEATQLKRHFDIDSEIASVIKPAVETNSTCSDWLIGWGQLRRLADPLMQPRAQQAASMLLPTVVDWSVFFAGLQTSALTTPNTDWCLSSAARAAGNHNDLLRQRSETWSPGHLRGLH